MNKKNYIKLDTPNTTLLLDQRSGEKLYYGARIADAAWYPYESWGHKNVPSVDDLNRKNVMISHFGQGDNRQFMIELADECGNYNLNFILNGVEERELRPVGLPYAQGGKSTIVCTYIEASSGMKLYAAYTRFEDCDCIAVSHRLENAGNKNYRIRRFFSAQLDLDETGHKIVYYDGAWARERQKKIIQLDSGVFFTGSSCGFSSNRYNPFWMIEAAYGGYYAINLLYSGNHKEIAEASPLGMTRILTGLNDERLDWLLEPGQTFDTPQAVLLYASTAADITSEMHTFVRNHVLRGEFANVDRPIVFNCWEATYYDFDRVRLISLARSALVAGAECFVVDDGWFSHRDDDTRSLGDWTDNIAKTGGLASLADEIHSMGLLFGLWFEPEMISPNSELYRIHPEYALTGSRDPVVTRNQLMLDLVNPAVSAFLLNTMRCLLRETHVDYIKWDCNRVMTDYASPFARGGEYAHRYILALYDILERLTSEFPHVLFESCAGGGNRYDLGMLYYMPQIWTSDNTDCRDRLRIQEGTLVAYPPCTMSAHISAERNHQTGRVSSLAARFAVASAGILGYEYDFSTSEIECKTLARNTAFYKCHRRTFQYGRYHLLESAFGLNKASWIMIAEDGGEAIAVIVRVNEQINRERGKYRLTGLDNAASYRVTVLDKDIIFVAKGDSLNTYGINLEKFFGYDALFEPVVVMLLLERI